MTIRTQINMDLRRAGYPGIVHAMQNDINSRAVELRLMDNGIAWVVPDGVTAAVGYKKPDGTNGLYDTLPNGDSAVTIAGSVITAVLAPQMLAVPGHVSMVLCLQDANLNTLATFPISLIVEENPAVNAIKSENYYKYSTMEQLSNAVEETLKLLEDTVKTVEEKLANGDFVGPAGYSPVRGKDYWTEEDKREVTNEVKEFAENPENVVFPDGLKTTYPIGKVQLVNGMGTLVEPGGTLADFFNVFIDEKNPTTVQPSVSLSFPQADAYEVGEKITPSYSASLNPGSYTYGPATGVSATSWEVTDSKGNTSETASGSFPEIQVTDGMSYTITAKAEHTAGADPVTNTGNKYEAAKIPAGSKKKTSGAVTGYRNTFYGTLTEKGTLTSNVIRGLTGRSQKALADGNKFTITVPIGALRVVFAYPATLRDVTGVKDDAMGMPIETGFTKSTMDINGANSYDTASYKVYVMDFAGPLDTANTYTVTI